MPSEPLQLRFRVAGIPVAVAPSFWLVTAAIGFLPRRSLPETGIWVGVVFTSILVHELGHALAARAVGARATVRLHALGGLTFPDRLLGRWQGLFMSLAGPLAGFALGGLVWVARQLIPSAGPLTQLALQMGQWVNLGWGLINLFPVLPLDGGHVLAALMGPRRQRLGGIVGGAIGLIAAGISVWRDQPILALLFAFISLRNFQVGAVLRPAPASAAVEALLRQGWEALSRGEERDAARLAAQALSMPGGSEGRNRARDLLAWCALAQANPREALRHLEQSEPPASGRPLTWALVLEALGDPTRALPHALRAAQGEPADTSGALAVRLLSASGRHGDAERLAESFPWSRPGAREAAMAQAAAARGEWPEAARLRASAFEASGHLADQAYLAAVAFARAGDLDAAADWLKRALDAGFQDLDLLRAEAALAPVAARPEIDRLLATLGRC